MSHDSDCHERGENDEPTAYPRRSVLKSIGAAGAVSSVGALGASGTASATHPTYSNPVWEPVAPDPALIEVGGTYYAYATESAWGNLDYQVIPIFTSTDLYDWTFHDTVFGTRPTKCCDEPSSGDPTWKYNDHGVWAPDIFYHSGRGKYHLYYSLHGPDHDDSAIGCASSDNPDGPWTDHEKVVGGTNNTIDPDVIEHNGDLYMYFGSYSSPMHVTKLTSDGLDDAWGQSNWVQIARDGTNKTAFEGPHVVKRNGYFYLFLANDICCQGHSSDPPYATAIARSTDPTGPFLDKEGRDINNRAAETEILSSNERFLGTGHGESIIGPDGDRWWLYHAYDLQDPEKTDGGSWRRSLMLDKIEWEDDWPVIRGRDGTPTRSQVAPTAGDTTRPNAVADADATSVSSGTTINFDASSSTDSDGSISSYTWFLADGTVKTGETISHSYSNSGDYPVLLTVENHVGLVDKDTITIAVDEPTDSYDGIHRWKLDDGSGSTATDSVGNADGTVNGASWLSDTVHGGGLSFDGSNDHVECGSNLIDTTSSYSVAAWVTLDSHSNGWQTVACQEGSQVSPFYLQYSNNVNRFTMNMKAGDKNGSHSVKARQASRPDTGRWYHLVGVHDANLGEVRLYVDGKRESRKNFTSAWNSSGTFAFGRGYFDGSAADYWGGDLDHVQVFNQALTDAEAAYVASHVDYGKYHVEPVHAPGKAVETAGGGTDDGDNVQQWEYNDFPTQKWWIEHLGDGIYRLENANSGKYMEVAGAGTSDGDTIQQWSWNGGDHQKWRIELLEDGKHRFVNVNSGKVMEVAGADETNGADVQQWSWNEGDWQRFELNDL